ncbi:pyridoxal-phosphate dependent enzyme [Halobaculum sp. MBLA0147]|uniref:threonine synthase n=1 Tax=Halobaculum sp. MBLA0147 TaxID=3079934 RepID=UPI0035239EE4
MSEESVATHQHPVGEPETTFPLEPPLTAGDPRAEGESDQRALSVGYDYDAVDPALFDRPIGTGIDRWAPLLPPLAGPGLDAGGTPLVEVPEVGSWAGLDGTLYVKDESRNPTWSHKDRLNRVVTSAAVRADADGIVVASTGNHGASAAAHAARAGLDRVVFTVPGTPPAMEAFVRSYDAAVFQVGEHDQLVRFVDALAERGFHPATSRTRVHTGHPYGPEGYKTIAYETVGQLGGVPAAVAAPTAFAELLYGVWKGFRELAALGVVETTPQMIACEPATQAALSAAREREQPLVEIDAGPSEAHSIGGSRSTHRGYLTLEESDGLAVPVPEATTTEAQERLGESGFWQEFSAAAGVAGLRELGATFDGPVVALACSSGYKDGVDWSAPTLAPDAVVADVVDRAEAEYGVSIGSSSADR